MTLQSFKVPFEDIQQMKEPLVAKALGRSIWQWYYPKDCLQTGIANGFSTFRSYWPKTKSHTEPRTNSAKQINLI